MFTFFSWYSFCFKYMYIIHISDKNTILNVILLFASIQETQIVCASEFESTNVVEHTMAVSLCLFIYLPPFDVDGEPL